MDSLSQSDRRHHPMNELRLTREHWEQMQADVREREPEEACGLVAGRDGRSLRVFPVANSLHSPVRFRMEPREQLDVMMEIEKIGCDLIAIYHSHPAGPATPSPTDIAEAAYPDAINLIWSRTVKEWICRGFLIQDGQAAEVELVLMT